MSKNSTFFYTVNDFEKSNLDFIDINLLLDKDLKEFKDVYAALDKMNYEPNEKIINKILKSL